ncbi:MAG TPA: HNH endonuclease, partial [Kofleriaceae bacterium]|nr:HNH endonuclease [Kofleriaceae bacterium]
IFNEARAVLRMAGAGTALQILVLDALSSTTNIRVCDRSGIPQFDVDVPGRWTLGANMKVVDLNRDEKPDLLLVDTGTYAVLENISGQGCGSGGTCVPFGFLAHPPVELAYANGFPFTPSASWSHDMNGDGNPDLVQRTDDRMSIWYGRGRFRVDDTERQLAVLNRDGNELLNLNDWEVSWIDANKDGLADALMTFDGEPALFINEADHFQEVVAPVLEESIFLDLGAPIAGDLRARGDLDLVFLGNADASAVALTVPSSGLMIGSDDGKGTQVTFDYERAAAAPGLRQRPAVLRSLTVATAGYDEFTSEYTYAAPTMHSVGHFLIGFGNVGAAGPLTSEQVDFHHDDQIAAQVDASRLFDDRTPGLMKFSLTAYEEVVHSGVRVRRGKTSRAGWCAGTDVAACIAGSSPAAFETTEFLTYESGICPTEVRQTNRHGQLLTESTLAAPARLSGALHCISDAQTWTGTHADASRNFLLATRLTINDRGQVTQVEQLGGGESLVLQDVTYDPITHRVASVSAPGEGTQTFAYDAATGQLEEVTSPDGVVSSAQNRSPSTDALLELVGDRGPGGVLTSSFRYDGMERLAKRWTDFGGSSETMPLEAIDYQFPTTDFPGLIQVSALIDAAAATRQETAAWTYPDGAALASATRIPGRWVFGAVSTASRSELRAATWRRAPLLDPADVALESYGSLLSSTTLLGETTTAGFGHLVSSRNLVQQGVERGVADTLSLNESNLLVTASRENDTFETRRAVDASGRVVWMRNQASGITRYDHDAIGRVVGLSLVDGTRHRLNFDAFGRPDQVVRDGVGTVSYTYDPATGLLVFKDHIDADGVLERTVEFTYDGVGRVVERLHVQPDSGDESAFSFRYDGDVGDGDVLDGQKGYTTRIEGPAHALTAVRNPDGSEASSSLTLAGWMQVDVTSTYHASGAVKELHRTITRLSDGVVIDDVTTGHAYDAWGRLERIDVNGAALATLHYDDDGRVAWVDLPDGQRIDHFYDPATHRPSGYAHHGQTGASESGVQWTFNARGLVASETIGLGEDSWLRSYGYDSRGYLTRSEDPAQLATYSYMPAGLPNQITDERGTRTVFRGSARAITVAGIPYAYDASGRVTARGGTTFTYGPDGHLAEARAGARTLAYRYDADGNRILKYEDGSPTAGFLGGGYLTGDGFIAPVEIAGRLVGVLEGGTFHLLATDPRGTPLADRDGTPRPVSPYGVRVTRPDLSAALDYVEKGFDADLEAVRMGVRDYDPLLSQFRTPDPLFLESLEQCSANPVECNLFTYAANNPVSLRDPTGEAAWLVGVVVVWWLLENEGTANAPDHDDVPIPRPTVMDDVKGTAKVVVGAAGGAAGATLGKVGTNLVTRTVFAGAGGGAAAAGGTRAVDDAFRGELSSPGEYASDIATGAAAGALLSPLGLLPGRGRQMGPTRQELGIDDAVKPTAAAPAAQAPALRLVNGRRPINWRYAGRTHPSGVRFTAEGFPDFNPHAVARTRLSGLTGKYKVDAARANKAVGLDETPDQMVWHHVEDGETMLLIPKAIHNAVRHTGGSAIIRSRR